ncbi:MAG: hypothetical protein HQL31_08530, partial [Planctomycetes bacterium]|nr:hypothetical protein [Planctomycetota bacterium]
DLYLYLVPPARLFRLPFRMVYPAHLLSLLLACGGWAELASRTRRIPYFCAAAALPLGLHLLLLLAPGLLNAFWLRVLPGRVFENMQTAPTDSSLLFKILVLECLAALALLLYLSPRRRAGLALICLYTLTSALILRILPDSKVKEDYYTPSKTWQTPLSRVAIEDNSSLHNYHLAFGLSSPTGYDSLSLYSYRCFLDTLVPQDWSKHTREQLYDLEAPALGCACSSPAGRGCPGNTASEAIPTIQAPRRECLC